MVLVLGVWISPYIWPLIRFKGVFLFFFPFPPWECGALGVLISYKCILFLTPVTKPIHNNGSWAEGAWDAEPRGLKYW